MGYNNFGSKVINHDILTLKISWTVASGLSWTEYYLLPNRVSPFTSLIWKTHGDVIVYFPFVQLSGICDKGRCSP